MPTGTVFSEDPGAIEILGDFAFSLLARDKPRVDLVAIAISSWRPAPR